MTMTKFYFILVIAASVMACSPATQEMDAEDIENSNRENKPQGPKGEAKFKDTVINFGKITDGEVVEHTYTFTNVFHLFLYPRNSITWVHVVFTKSINYFFLTQLG